MKKVSEALKVSTKAPIALLPVDGLMLWDVHFKSSYYDNDPRMPVTVPVDEHFFVLATNKDEALRKTESQLARLRRRYKKADTEIVANLIALENLIPARDASNDDRMGWISTKKLDKVQLSLAEDRKRYRLGVCLIPIE